MFCTTLSSYLAGTDDAPFREVCVGFQGPVCVCVREIEREIERERERGKTYERYPRARVSCVCPACVSRVCPGPSVCGALAPLGGVVGDESQRVDVTDLLQQHVARTTISPSSMEAAMHTERSTNWNPELKVWMSWRWSWNPNQVPGRAVMWITMMRHRCAKMRVETRMRAAEVPPKVSHHDLPSKHIRADLELLLCLVATARFISPTRGGERCEQKEEPWTVQQRGLSEC